MNVKTIFSAIIKAVLCMGIANAQFTPSTQRVSFTGKDKTILDQHLGKYTAFSIDKRELTDSLYGNGGSGSFRLRVDDKLDWTIDLELNDLRTSIYRATYTTDKGTFELKEPFVVNTFKGKTSNGQIARFTIDENNFFGVIFGENYHYVIRPAKDYTQNWDDKSFIVYHSWDIIPNDDYFDYINDTFDISDDVKNINMLSSNDNTRSSCPNYFLTIATDADFEFHQARGGTTNSSAEPTNNYILSILNIAEGVYESTEGVYESTFGLRFRVNFQNVYTKNTQPYTSTTGDTLLFQFRNYWNSNHTFERNIAHLFTGKILNGGNTLGISYTGQLHNPWGASYGYGVSSHDAMLMAIVTHEIGHNLNAKHANNTLPSDCLCDDPNDPFGVRSSIMCPFMGSPQSLWFCQQSINEISSFLQLNRDELIGICGPNMVCLEGSSFELVSAPVGTVTWVISSGPFSFSLTSNQTSKVGNPVTVYRSSTGTGNGMLKAIPSSPIADIYSLAITPCPIPVISGSSPICNGTPKSFSATNWIQGNYYWEASNSLVSFSCSTCSTTNVSATSSINKGTTSVYVKNNSGTVLAT